LSADWHAALCGEVYHHKNQRRMQTYCLSPQNLAKTIAAAGVEARKQEQAALDQATTTFVTVANQLTGFVASAHKDQEQIKWLLWTAAGSAVLGALLWTALAFIANSLAPESWHWPEKSASSALGRDMWSAGERLQAVPTPSGWKCVI
jgi:hypothetical protein